MFKNPFSFDGRIRRLEYGLSFIVYFVSMLVFSLIIMVFTAVWPWFMLLFLLLFPAAIWFLFAQAAKRSHDVGYSGWCILIPFYNVYLLFADGDYGANRFGPNPKNLGNNAPEIEHIGKTA